MKLGLGHFVAAPNVEARTLKAIVELSHHRSSSGFEHRPLLQNSEGF